jgi:ABC-type glycerol-3-phosphate transport system substrate-binding protein
MDMKPNRLLALMVSTGMLAVAAGSQAQDSASHTTAADGTPVTVTSGQPPKDAYTPAPAFEQLDTNHDGFISREEAEAYLPLLNDYDNLLTEYHHPKAISKRQFDTWNRAENHQ